MCVGMCIMYVVYLYVDIADMICNEASSSSCNVASSTTGDCYPAGMMMYNNK